MHGYDDENNPSTLSISFYVPWVGGSPVTNFSEVKNLSYVQLHILLSESV